MDKKKWILKNALLVRYETGFCIEGVLSVSYMLPGKGNEYFGRASAVEREVVK